jgi:uncharacterized MAPEG superfamily protein
MQTSVLVLLAFAVWTLLTLLVGVGIYRWSLILSGRAQLVDFPADQPGGSARYRRAMRAHANCLENLPVYGAIVLAIAQRGVVHPALDVLAIVFLCGRIGQTLVHVVLPTANVSVAVRFVFFVTQLGCMFWMARIAAFA